MKEILQIENPDGPIFRVLIEHPEPIPVNEGYVAMAELWRNDTLLIRCSFNGIGIANFEAIERLSDHKAYACIMETSFSRIVGLSDDCDLQIIDMDEYEVQVSPFGVRINIKQPEAAIM